MGQEHNINETQRGMSHYPMVVYHGTSPNAAKKILEEGKFVTSPEGMLGEGVYTTSSLEEAKLWSSADGPDGKRAAGRGEVVQAIIHARKPIQHPSESENPKYPYPTPFDNTNIPEHDVWEVNDKVPEGGNKDIIDSNTWFVVKDPSVIVPHRIVPWDD